MKASIKIFIVLLFAFSARTFGQPSSIFHLNKLSAQDTLVSGWKMYAGDEARFASPFLDDSKWLPIDLTKDIQQYSQLYNQFIKGYTKCNCSKSGL